jgi:hypothetical protein
MLSNSSIAANILEKKMKFSSYLHLRHKEFTSYSSLTWSRNSFSASPLPKSGFTARPCGSFSSFVFDSVHDAYSRINEII